MTMPSSAATHSTLLYVDPNPERARELQRWLARDNVDLIFASGYMAAVTALARQPIDLLIASFSLPEGNGLELLRIARRDHAQIGGALMLEPEELAAAAAGLREEGWEWLVRDKAGAFLQLLPGMAEKWLEQRAQGQHAAHLREALVQAQTLAATAAGSCSHGLAIFDGDMRLALCNSGFLAYFAYPPELGAPGTPLRDMLVFNLQRGDYGNHADIDEVERRLRRLRNGRDFRFQRPSRQGQTQAVEGRHLPDGGMVMRFFGMDGGAAQREEEQARLQQDALTGLPNAALFQALLQHQVRRGSRSGYNGAALFLLELEGLGDIGRLHGAEMADAARKETAHRLARAVRECDVLARLEGDRFGILLIDVNTQENVEIVAGKLLRALAPVYHDGAVELRLDAAIGAAFQPTELCSAVELMGLAENGLEQAKSAGKNHYRMAVKN